FRDRYCSAAVLIEVPDTAGDENIGYHRVEKDVAGVHRHARRTLKVMPRIRGDGADIARAGGGADRSLTRVIFKQIHREGSAGCRASRIGVKNGAPITVWV